MSDSVDAGVITSVPRTQDVSDIATGTLLFRDQGPAPTKDGRKIVLVVGMMAVPQDSSVFVDGRMTAIAELRGLQHFMPTIGSDRIFGISSFTWEPRTKESGVVDLKGLTPNDLVTLPIWRV